MTRTNPRGNMIFNTAYEAAYLGTQPVLCAQLEPRYLYPQRYTAKDVYEVPMTQAIEGIIEIAGNYMDGRRICEACKDCSFCPDCLFAAHTEEKGGQA